MRQGPVLVVKLGALGDFLYALGPMQAIRRHHAGRRLVLLTRPAYADLGRQSGLFEDIWTDPAPRLHRIGALLALRRRLRRAGFARAYDLQTSDRTALYFRLFAPGPWPEWSGTVPGASHRHRYRRPSAVHTIERQRDQLRLAGIAAVPAPDLGFLDGDITRFGLPAGCVALVPGSSPGTGFKRWPATRYGELAAALHGTGHLPVILGGEAEAATAAAIRAACPAAIDLCGRTGLGELAAVGRRAALAIGNDTGPTHLLALAGCPTLALLGSRHPVHKVAPRGPQVVVLSCRSLTDLPVARVRDAARQLLAAPA